jgi:uridine phosphorylase
MKGDTMSRSAWYIGAKPEDIGEAAILIGDPARIDRIAPLLANASLLEENRGLRTVTGEFSGKRITASAFGMGAPIAAIVLHELFDLGVRAFLRIGTAMAIPPVALGDFVLAEAALRGEGTSVTYAPLGYPAVADFALNATLRVKLAQRSRPWRSGVFGSYDGFYTEMFALDDGERTPIEALKKDIRRLGLIATDMETSALLTAGRVLGARVSSLCVATVEAMTQAKLPAEEMARAETDLFEVALSSLAEHAEASVGPGAKEASS